MPYRDKKRFFEKAEMHGKYGFIRHPSGTMTVWKRDWKKPAYVPTQDKVRRVYEEQKNSTGRVSDGLRTQIALYGALITGKGDTPAGRKYLNLPEGRNILDDEKAKAAIRDFWKPRKKENHSYEPGKVPEERLSITAFMASHQDIYKFLARPLSEGGKYGSFRGALEQQGWFPGLYAHVSSRRCVINHNEREELAALFVKRSNKGLNISPSIKNSPIKGERKLYLRIMQLTEAEKETNVLGEEKRKNYAEMVSALTGISVRDIVLGKGSHKRLANLTELFTYFFFSWGSILGLEPLGKNYPSAAFGQENTRFSHQNPSQDHSHFSDLRTGNTPIEVKCAIQRIKRKTIEEILEKYSKDSQWKSGEGLEKTLLIFHCAREYYAEYETELKEAGLKVLGCEQFRNQLENLLREMKKGHNFRLIGDLKPLSSLDYILDLYDEASQAPFLLLREAGRQRLDWSTEVLKALNKRAGELKS